MTWIAYERRIARLRSLAEEKGLDGVIVVDEPSVFYFTGYRGAGLLAVTRDSAYLLVPVLEYLHALHFVEEEGADLEVVVYKPYGLPGRLVVEEAGVRVEEGRGGDVAARLVGASCGLVGGSRQFWERLASICKQLSDLSRDVSVMRMRKEPWELERIEAATRIAEEALRAAISMLDYGVSEAEVAGEILRSILADGGEGPSFSPIVAFGENTVYPHAAPSTSRVLTRPTPVLIDLGAVYKGYCSDMTRTLFYNGSPAEFRHVAEAVYEAVSAALDAAKPGAKASEVDAAARGVLEKYGLAKYFIHSTGHGVGIEVHEAPRVTFSDGTVLEPGMVITIEPGVYIPGKLGVRIEELVVITSRGAGKITRFPAWLWQ